MSLPSINQDAMEEVSPEENLRCPLRNGRDYSSNIFIRRKKCSCEVMLQEGLGPIQMAWSWPTISKNTFYKWRLKERKGLPQ